MTVNVGPDRYLGATTLLGATQTLGQGNSNTAKDVEYELLFSTDDASVSIPNWVYITSSMRAFSTSRGRSSERSTVDAGTATITLDNRTRTYDPANTSSIYSPNLRPMNRVWLRARFNGLTHDIFKGYVESYEQQYPELGMDAVTVIHAADEFKILALRNLPTTSPPRDTYTDLVQFDQPVAFWTFNDDFVAALTTAATVGPNLVSPAFNAVAGTTDGAIAGENPQPYAALTTNSTQAMNLGTITNAGDPPDLQGATEATVELWINPDQVPSTNTIVLVHLKSSTLIAQYSLAYNTTGTLSFVLRDSGATNHTVTGGSLTIGAWNHVCAVASGATLTLYINGVSVATTGWSAVVVAAVPSQFTIGGASAAGGTYSYDALAIYRQALDATRVAAHYDAGTNRGFARQALAGGAWAEARISAILDSVSSQTPRNLMQSYRPLAGQWTGNGPPVMDVLRDVETADAIDAMLFIACDGTITFLSSAYRTVAPYTTVQATFGDIGNISELDFMDIQLDYSDSYIANEWNVTRAGGATFTASDTTSQTRYLKRPQSLTDLLLADDSYTQSTADLMLAKYKDPFTRVLSITPKMMDVNVIDAVFPLDLGDRVTVKLTPPGGGTRFSQTLFIQSITVDMTPAQVFPTVKLGVSPV